MKLVDYEKYYHSGSEFIIPTDEFEKIIEENQRLEENNQAMQEEMARTWKKYDEVNNILNELEKDFKKYNLDYLYETYQTNLANFIDVELSKLQRLKELKESDK